MKASVHPPAQRPPVLQRLDHILLCVMMGLIVLRAAVIENPHLDQPQTRLMLSAEVVSLLISAVLLVCFAVWLLAAVLFNQFRWRKAGFGPAAALFFLAGLLSAFFASDKRAAVTDAVTLLCPMLTALLLVQLLDTRQSIRLVLLLLAAVGAAAAVQCADQLMTANQMLIADYQADPVQHLQKLGIEPNSLEHWMYEHRLYSKDIRGFLMTSNSSASFFLLAFFAAFGLFTQAVAKDSAQEQTAAAVCYGLAAAVCGAGVLMTQSKGGIGALLLGLLLWLVLFGFGQRIWQHRRLAGAALLLAVLLTAAGIIAWGIRYGRLPGGNSMLVRWQYWQSTAQMIRDHLPTGVGGGNFSESYMYYKNPAASETIQNPHSWPLSLLSQYGPLGLLAFVWGAFGPMLKSFRSRFTLPDNSGQSQSAQSGLLWAGLLACCGCMLLFVRPALVDTEFLYQNVEVRSAAYLVLYLVPAGVFVLAYVLLWAASTGDRSPAGRSDRLNTALLCGLAAVLIHNLIDFAVFEPGIWSIFWLLTAVLMADFHLAGGQTPSVIHLDAPVRLGAAAGLALVCAVYAVGVLLPPVRANQLLKQALRDDRRRIELLDRAIACDPLSPKTAYTAAAMFTQTYRSQRVKDVRFLEKALDFAEIAGRRNPASFKPFRLRGEIYSLLAQQADGTRKTLYLEKAAEAFRMALERYPGSDRMHFALAAAAEQLHQPQTALQHYQRAVEIEDAYRIQFRTMYPDRQTVISRLGHQAYQEAKEKIQTLGGAGETGR
ncbi:MAG TPA: O-antigen ligase family protein [Anaerohalosphaeraceae bacterium]|nr:O-antigen ligase family protein [Anaerohalosphaeraceae bacterium]HOM76007.1 O-antigen ligase family protein [Anaerohalosphaeraceae bacterium]HPC64591.1 O-antigen ligase family protein [Anaerohalosphaeraceae bacterium]HPO70173.1 O-antigen ligase family protein [Anaerohalosphaeraceae bacterium]HRS71629.1 O-antigen ligase family protein [Anaerohalosphaeraceae bacterium]